jgi:hypothetical protein
VLQDALEEAMMPSGSRRNTSEPAVTATKAAAKRAAAAVIAAGGDERQLEPAAASLLSRVLGPVQMKKLLLPLLRLRQACCHPQVCVHIQHTCFAETH